MAKRKKKTVIKKKKESSEDTQPPAKKVDSRDTTTPTKKIDITENEASSTSHLEEDLDQVQSFTSISLLNTKSDSTDQSHYWCNYCSFSTDAKKDLIGHMREHMKKCPYCTFASLSLKEVAKHSKMEHDKDLDAVSQETESSTTCEIDKDPCSACVFCEFMTYSTEHLERHTVLKHPGMLTKSVAKMITKSCSAEIRKNDALFYLNISDKNFSELKSSSAELSTIVIDVPEENTSRNIKLEAKHSPLDVKVNQLTHSLLGKDEDCFSSNIVEFKSNSSKEAITSSDTAPDWKVKVETMYCLTCPYSNVYVEKLKCHTLAQHPLGAAVCTYNSTSESSTDLDITFFCIREYCSFNTVDSKSYQQHLMNCCSSRSSLTLIEKERLQASLAYVISFQKKYNKVAEIGFSNFVQPFTSLHDKASSSVSQSHLNDDMNTLGQSVPKVQSQFVLSEMQLNLENQIALKQSRPSASPVEVTLLGSNSSLVLPEKSLARTPKVYPTSSSEIRKQFANSAEQFIGPDRLTSTISSSQLSSTTDMAFNKQQLNAISTSVLLPDDCISQQYISQQTLQKETQRETSNSLSVNSNTLMSEMLPTSLPSNSIVQNTNNALCYQDILSQPLQSMPVTTVECLNNEQWQTSASVASVQSSMMQGNQISPNVISTESTQSFNSNPTSVPNFLVPANNTVSEAEAHIEQTHSTFLTPSKTASVIAQTLSTPPKSTSNMTNAAGSSPLSPSIYLSGQGPRHQRTNWTDADMRPRGLMMPPVPNMMPPYNVVPGHHVRQRLFAPNNVRGRGRVRMSHMPRQNKNDDDDDVIVTAVVRNAPAARRSSVNSGPPSQFGRIAPMTRLPPPQSANRRMRGALPTHPRAPPPKQFDISKHFEDLACVVNSAGDEDGVFPGDDDIQILGVTPAKEKEKLKQPRAVDASKFSFCCVHCGKDQGSKQQMKQHMKSYHNDSLIGAFTNLESGQLLFFCPQLVCEFMTYDETRLSEHLQKCYNLENSKSVDIITAIKNLKSLKIRQLDVRSLGRSQTNQNHLNGQGLKDNFSNSLNDAFDDIVVNASGRHMSKPSLHRPLPVQQNHFTPPHQNAFTSRYSGGAPVPVKQASGFQPPLRPRFYGQSPFPGRPLLSEMPRHVLPRFPNTRPDLRSIRGMHPVRSGRPVGTGQRGQARSSSRPIISGPQFGGEQEPIVIDDEPSSLVTSGSLHSELTATHVYETNWANGQTTAAHSSVLLEDTGNKVTNVYNLRNQTLSDTQGTTNDFLGSVQNAINVTSEQSITDINFTSNISDSTNYNFRANVLEPSTSMSQYSSDSGHLYSTSAQTRAIEVTSLSHNECDVFDPNRPRVQSLVSSPEAIHENNATPGENGDEEEKNYANMLEKVFAKIPNMPKTLSQRLIFQFKQYSQNIGVKITSKVVDEFVNKISYRGSKAAKPVAPVTPPLEQEQSSAPEVPSGTDIHPCQNTPDVLTTKVIMANTQLTFSGPFAKIPFKKSDSSTSMSDGSVSSDSCNYEKSSTSTEGSQTVKSTDTGNKHFPADSNDNAQNVLSHSQQSSIQPFHIDKRFQMKQKNLLRRHSADLIHQHTTSSEVTRSSSCPLNLSEHWLSEPSNAHTKIIRTPKLVHEISSQLVGVTAEDVHASSFEVDFAAPSISLKENCLSLMSSSSPILISSSVDPLVSQNKDIEIDIAGKPENPNLLLVEKLEPLDSLDHEPSDGLERESFDDDLPPEGLSSINKLMIPETKHLIKKHSVKGKRVTNKNKNSSLIDTKTGKLILKITKRGRPRSKPPVSTKSVVIAKEDLEVNKIVSKVEQKENSITNEKMKVKTSLETKEDVDVTEKTQSNNNVEMMSDCDRTSQEDVIDLKKKDGDEEEKDKSDVKEKGDSEANDDFDQTETDNCERELKSEIFVRRSDRKRKTVQSDYREADLDELLEDSEEDYNFDDDSENDESTWMKQSGLTPVSKKKVKKPKDPPDPTAFDISIKGKFKCWLCKKVFLKTNCAKAHLLKKHKEGLCCIDVIQSEETDTPHLLLYCLHDCKYATFSLDGFKNHMANCQKPEYSGQEENFFKQNETFIEMLYPELMKTDVKDLVQTSTPKDPSKSSKPKKTKKMKDAEKTSSDPHLVSGEDLPQPPNTCSAVHKMNLQTSSADFKETYQSHVPADVLNYSAKVNYSVSGNNTQQFTRLQASEGRKSLPEQSTAQLNNQQHSQKIPIENLAQRSTSEQLAPRFSTTQQAPRLTAEQYTPKPMADQLSPRFRVENTPRPMAGQHLAGLRVEQHAPRLITEQHLPRFRPGPLIDRPPTCDQQSQRFPEQSLRLAMQSKHNLTYQTHASQSHSVRSMAQSGQKQQAQKDLNVQLRNGEVARLYQTPKHGPPSRQVTLECNQKVRDESYLSEWHVESISQSDQQETDGIFMEEDGIICLE
ncbi:hypothetical protein BgiMline_013768 [Biomphalaria glabrata]|nr:hypothetical protein BgiMline_012581 [Biomphalaria glabrata]